MIEIFRRNTLSKPARFVNEQKNPIDISGYKVKTILKKDNDVANNDSNALVKREELIIDGANGEFSFYLTSAETNIPAGIYKYEVQLSKNGEIITAYQSKIKILETYIYE